MQLQWKSEWTVPSIVGAVSFGIGVGIGYGIRSYLNYRLVKEIEGVMDRVESDEEQLELDLSGEDDHNMVYSGPYNVEEIFSSIKAHPSNGIPESEIEVVSVFPDEEEDDWDYVEEMANRTPDAPYIIHLDEYNDETDEDGKMYSKSTLTYYRGDDVLCDDKDMPIYNYQKTASPLTFGKGSQDPSIVFIRNETLEADYEVILDTGYYQVEVLGEEFEHSFDNQKAPLPKFRPE